MLDNEEEFYNWHSAFGKDIDELRTYFKRCQSAHKDLRELLGNIEGNFVVEIANEQQFAIDDENRFNNAMYDIDKMLVKEDWDKIGLEKSDLKLPTNKKFKDRIINIIRDYQKKWQPYHPKIAYLNQGLSKLENLWNDHLLKAGEWNVKIDTSMKGFCKLGHYGCDDKSCFNNTGSRFIHKYRLSIVPNTFVLSFENIKTNKIMGRAWGWFNPQDRVLNVCNYYQYGINNLTAAECMKWIAGALIDVDVEDITLFRDKIPTFPKADNEDGEGRLWIFKNDDKGTDWSFSNNREIDNQEPEIDEDDFDNL